MAIGVSGAFAERDALRRWREMISPPSHGALPGKKEPRGLRSLYAETTTTSADLKRQPRPRAQVRQSPGGWSKTSETSNHASKLFLAGTVASAASSSAAWSWQWLAISHVVPKPDAIWSVHAYDPRRTLSSIQVFAVVRPDERVAERIIHTNLLAVPKRFAFVTAPLGHSVPRTASTGSYVAAKMSGLHGYNSPFTPRITQSSWATSITPSSVGI